MLAIAMMGCAGDGVQAPACATNVADPAYGYNHCKIIMKNSKYSPAEVYIQTGTKVTWVNSDEADHSVYTSSGVEKLASEVIPKGGNWDASFDQAGVVVYVSRHPASLPLGSMRGQITIQERT